MSRRPGDCISKMLDILCFWCYNKTIKEREVMQMFLVEWKTSDTMYHCGMVDERELVALWDNHSIDIISVEPL